MSAPKRVGKGAPRDDDEQPPGPRVAPASHEAEIALLSCCLTDTGETIGVCIQTKLPSEAFHTPANRIIYEVLVDVGMRNINGSTDEMLVIVHEELKKRKLLAAIGGYATLTEVTKLYSAQNPRYFLEVVRGYYHARLGIEAAEAIKERFYGGGDIEDITAAITPALNHLNGMAIIDRDETLKQVAARVRQNIQNQSKGEPVEGEVLNIGIPVADAVLRGLSPKRDYMVIIAARPSVGKTTLATQIMQHVMATVKDWVIIDFQLENSRDNHVAQMGSRFAQMDLNRKKEWTEQQITQFDKYVARIEDVADKQLYVYEHDTTIEQIEARARFIKRKHGKVTLMVVDYIQLVGTLDSSIRDERKVLNNVSRRLKLLAKEIGCPFLVLAQLSREFEKDGREPQLRDLKESGNLEADADRVWMLHVPKDAKFSAQTGCIATRLIQRKNKYGPVGAVDLLCKRTTTTFFAADRQEEEVDPHAPADV